MEHGQYIELARALAGKYRELSENSTVRLSTYHEVIAEHLDQKISAQQMRELANQVFDAEDLFTEQLARSPLMTGEQESILRAECYDQVITTWLKKQREDGIAA